MVGRVQAQNCAALGTREEYSIVITRNGRGRKESARAGGSHRAGQKSQDHPLPERVHPGYHQLTTAPYTISIPMKATKMQPQTRALRTTRPPESLTSYFPNRYRKKVPFSTKLAS
jgi:hypothetical protein